MEKLLNKYLIIVRVFLCVFAQYSDQRPKYINLPFELEYLLAGR